LPPSSNDQTATTPQPGKSLLSEVRQNLRSSRLI
jgi:hypothetical protein